MTDREPPDRSVLDSIPRSLRIAAGWSWRLLGVLLLVTAVTLVVIRLQVLFVALFVALLLTALLQPGMALLRRYRVPRVVATAIVLLVAVGGVAGLLFLVGRAFAGQAEDLVAAVTDGFEQVQVWVDETFGISAAQIAEWVSGVVQNAGEAGSSLGSGVFGAASTALEVLAGAGIALFATIFFVYDGPGIWRWVTSLFPARVRGLVDEGGQMSWQTLASYARGTVLIALIDAIGIGLGVALLGVPLAFPIAVVVFFGAFIPIVGATVSGLVAALIALATQGVTTALLVVGVVLLVQQIEGQILQPLIQGKFVSIHPLAVVLAVAAGSIVAGLIGAVIAVPIVAVLNVLVRFAAEVSRRGREPGSAAPAPGPEPPDEPLEPRPTDDESPQARLVAGREETT